MKTGPVDFVIITALKVERDAVLRRLPPVETLQEAGDPRPYYLAHLNISNLDLRKPAGLLAQRLNDSDQTRQVLARRRKPSQ